MLDESFIPAARCSRRYEEMQKMVQGFQPTGHMTEDILALLQNRGGRLSFAEIVHYIPAARGDVALNKGKDNLLIWESVSHELVDAIDELERNQTIELRDCSRLTYLVNGHSLDLPIACEIKDYATPHWVPSILCLRQQQAA